MNTGTVNKVCYILPRLLKTSFKKDPAVFSLIINANFLCVENKKLLMFDQKRKTFLLGFLSKFFHTFSIRQKKKPLSLISFVIGRLTQEKRKSSLSREHLIFI